MLAPDRTAEVAALLQEGIASAKAGDKETAKQKIQRVTELEPNNEAAWLWLASTYSELNVAAYCLQRALALNPDNDKASQALANIQQRMISNQNAALAADALAAMASGQAAPGWDTAGQSTQVPSLDYEELKRRGIVAAKGGRRDEAKSYLLAATEANDGDAETWLWLATVVEDPEDKQIALENVLTLDPLNEAAQAELKENAVRLAKARSGSSQPLQASPTMDLQWERDAELPPAFPLVSGPLQSGGLNSSSSLSSSPLSGPTSQSTLFASPTAGATAKAAPGKVTPPQVGDFIAFRYKVMSATAGSIGMDYTANELGSKNFYTLRAQKCEISDLKKTKVNFVVDRGVPYTLVPMSTSGFTLRSFIDTLGRMPTEVAVGYTQVMLKRLQAMHAKGPVLTGRKQVTPDTVTFGADGEIALEADDQKTMAPEDGVGQKFLPPELVRSGSPAPTSDIYAIGALLYFMVTGAPPPPANAMPRKQGDTVSPAQFADHPEVPAPLVKVLATAMQPNPTDRYPSAQAMNDALAASGLGKKVRVRTLPPAAMIGAAVAAVAVLALGFLVATGRLGSVSLPFVDNASQQKLVLVLPTPAPVLPTATPVPLVPLAKVNAHTVDTRRFPTNSVFFSATDANGVEISGLSVADVKVTDNGADGKNMQLAEIRNTTDPVSIIFALDNSLLMKGHRMDDAKTAIHLLVEQMPAGDQMALLTFGGQLRYVLDYTVSKTEFLAAVDGVQPSGKPDIFPAVMLAAERTKYQPQGGYTALIVISNSPMPASKPVMLATTHAANLANLPVFYLGLDKSTYTADAAQQLASQTGGLAVVAEKTEAGGAWDAMRKIDDQLHNVYKLTYDATSLDTKAEHTTEVTVTSNGVTQKDTRNYEVLNK